MLTWLVREMVQSVMCSVWKHEDLSLNLQHPWSKLGAGNCCLEFHCWEGGERRALWSCWSASLANLANSMFSGSYYFKKIIERVVEEDVWWPLHAYTRVHVSTRVQRAEHTYTHKGILVSCPYFGFIAGLEGL